METLTGGLQPRDMSALLLTNILAFLILLWILKRFAWGPLLRMIDARRDKTGVAVTSRRLARGEIILAGFPAGAELDVRIDERTSTDKADESGRVTLKFREHGTNRVEVRLR